MKRRLLVAGAMTVSACCLGAAPAPGAIAGEPNPAVSGPLTGGLHGHPFLAARYQVADYGYTEKEYVYAGTAKAYGVSKPDASFASRMLVEAPSDPRKFSGTVYVEWDNVTAQADGPADYFWLYPKILADGDAYVQVTAQQVGVCGAGLTGAPVAGATSVCTPTSVKGFDPIRYAALHHPGDDYSYDIFSQALQAVKHPRGIAPLAPLKPTTVLAVGESQSAYFLDDYMRFGADAAAELADGFLIDADVNRPEPAVFRVPTLYIWSEDSARDVTVTAGPNHVAWSVSGAAHTDYWLVRHILTLVDTELNLPPRTRAAEEADEQSEGVYAQQGPDASVTCAGGSEYPRRYVMDAAAADLATWARGGPSAPAVPPLKFSPGVLTAGGSIVNVGVGFQTDAQGNALGGLREPVITVPVATYIGNACPLLGTSTPLSPAQLSALYPTHADYVRKMNAATVAAVTARFMTRRDGLDLMTRACQSAIPAWGTTSTADLPALCSNLEALLPPPVVSTPAVHEPVAHKPVAHKPVATLTSSQKPVHRAGVTTPSPTSGLAATGGPPLLAVVAIVSIGAAILARRVRGQRSLASMLDATTTPP